MACNDGSHSEEYWNGGGCKYCGLTMLDTDSGGALHDCANCGAYPCDCDQVEDDCETCSDCQNEPGRERWSDQADGVK